MTKVIGLTGGIGSGKSTIANYIRAKGIPVYIADDEAKKLLDTPIIEEKIKSTFGETIYENHRLNKAKLAEMVFNNPTKLNKLNSIIHPEVRKHFKTWLKANSKAPFVVKEAAILFESGSNSDCDFVISVLAPVEDRISRVLARDDSTRQEVISRMNNQWSDEMRRAKSDFVIENIELSKSFEQVDEILKKLKIQ